MVDDAVVERMLGRLAEHAGAEAAFVGEVLDGSLVIRWAHGLEPRRTAAPIKAAALPHADVISENKPLVVGDAGEHPTWARADRLGPGAIVWRAYAGWPLSVGDTAPHYVLSVVATAARTWDETTLAYGADLTDLVAALLDDEQQLAHLAEVVRREERARVARRELQRLAAAAVSATGVDDVAKALVTGTRDVFGARLVVLGLPDGADVRIVHGPTVPVDVQRDWQRAASDLEMPLIQALREDASWIELPDPDAIAAWPMLVPEARRSGIRSMVTAPLRPSAGAPPIASLSIGFEEPFRLDELDRSLLAELAELASHALQRGRQLDESREVAETLQQSLLPRRLPRVAGVRVRSLYVPGTDIGHVGGDWYDVVPLDDGAVGFVVGDVAGHDLGAAAEMGQLRHVVASQLLEHGDAPMALDNADRYCHLLRRGAFATVIVIVLDAARAHLSITSAGHLPPLLIGVDGEVSALDTAPGPPVGAGIGGYTSTSAGFEPDATLIAFTDGLVERRRATLDECVIDFASRLASLRTLEPAAIVRAIRDHLVAGDHADDAAALVVQRRGDDTPTG